MTILRVLQPVAIAIVLGMLVPSSVNGSVVCSTGAVELAGPAVETSGMGAGNFGSEEGRQPELTANDQESSHDNMSASVSVGASDGGVVGVCVECVAPLTNCMVDWLDLREIAARGNPSYVPLPRPPCSLRVCDA